MDECDWTLLTRFSQHEDHGAFTALVRRHRPLVQATCRRVIGNRSDSEDAVQATFFQLARNAERLVEDSRPQRSLAAWLSRVATNTCLDTMRSLSARRSREQEYLRRRNPDSGRVSTENLVPLVDELVHELPEKYREPIVLCYLQGKQHSRAASELGITVSAIRRRIQSAKSMLRSRFAGRGIPVSMFLLHMLMDNLAAGADPSTGTTPASTPATELPLPTQSSSPVTTTGGAASAGKLAAGMTQGHWAFKVGLLSVAIGVITLLYHSIGEGNAVESPAAANPAVALPDEVEPQLADQLAPADEPDSLVVSNRNASPPIRHARESREIAEPRMRMFADREPPSAVAPPEDPPESITNVALTLEMTTDRAVPMAEEPAVAIEPEVPLREVEELFGIEWHKTIESATAAAREEPDRPILCFRVLGELSGFM